MKTIKIINKNYLAINNKILYKGYLLGDLPPTFSFLFKEDTKWDDDKETYETNKIYGINKWFNYKGLTWIKL
tara:strand:+ start:730 stop:945 length:216 start_codon:yes stop_codon:yes gene_type:complete